MLVVGGVEQPVEVERQERPRGGAQGYWRCPACDRLCCALYVVENALACRLCHRLTYRSRVLQRHRGGASRREVKETARRGAELVGAATAEASALAPRAL